MASEGSSKVLKATFEANATGTESLESLASVLERAAKACDTAQAACKRVSTGLDGLGKSADSAAEHTESLKALAEACQSFKGASINKNLATQLAALTDAAKGMGGMDNVKAMTEAVNGLGGVRLSSTVATQLAGIATGAQALNGVDMGGVTAAKSALAGLDGVKVSTTLGRGVSALGTALTSFPNTESAQKVLAASYALQSLQGLSVPKGLGTNLTKMADGLRALNGTDIPADKMRELADAMQVFAEVPKNSLSSTINAMAKLPKAVEGLNGTDMDMLAAKAKELVEALGDMPDQLQKCANGFQALQSVSGSALNEASQKTSTLIDKVHGLWDRLTSVGSFVAGLESAWNSLNYFISAANDYVEGMNLFNVSLGEYADQARAYADQVTQVMGINPQEWLEGQGTFATLAQGMGVASDSAAVMSQQLTQLAYDLASFYNMDVEETFAKLQSGMAGETRAVRDLGYDISDAALQEEALALGIDKSTSEMTQAEKVMLRYHAMLTQVAWAQGDMSRTLESPANMLRVLQGQFQMAATAIGQAFLPMMQAIVPWAIAVMKVITKLAQALASFTGGLSIANKQYSSGKGTSSSGGAPAARAYSLRSASSTASPMSATNGLALAAASPVMFAAKASTASAATATDGLFSNNASSKGVMQLAEQFDDLADSAQKAYYRIREVRDETLGFDELHIIDPYELVNDTSSSGAGGSGGAGGDLDGLDAALADIDIPTYDFLGDATDMFAELEAAVQQFVDRAGKLLLPLYDSFAGLFEKIARQAMGLPLADALQSACLAGLAVVSSFSRNVIDTLAPMMLAFNVPQTVTTGLVTVAQLGLTLATAFETAGAMAQAFNKNSLTPLAEWVGQKLRDALNLATDGLKAFRDWLVNNESGLVALATAAGKGAGAVLAVATAVADVAFSTAATVITTLVNAFGDLMSVLVNSQAAQTAATLLGAAITAWALKSAIVSGINLIASSVEALGNKFIFASVDMRNSATNANTTVSGAWSNLKTMCSQLSKVVGNLWGDFKQTAPAQACKSAIDKVKTSAETAAGKLVGLGTDTNIARKAQQNLKDAATKASEKLGTSARKAQEAANALKDGAGTGGKFNTMLLNVKSRAANAQLKVDALKASIAQNKAAMAELEAQGQRGSKEWTELANQTDRYKQQLVGATASAGAATVAEGALTVAKTLGAAASNLLATAMKAIPGMALAAAFQAVLSALQPLVEWIGNGILEFFGFKTATEDATEAEAEAEAQHEAMAQALQEEQDRLNEVRQSLEDYTIINGNMRGAINEVGEDLDSFTLKLDEAGVSVDELTRTVDENTNSIVNGFDKLDTSSGISLDQMISNLQSNLAVTREFSENMKILMERTGLDSTSALVQELMSDPAKYANAVKEGIEDPTGEKLSQLKSLFAETEEQATNAAVSAVEGKAGAMASATDTLVNASKSSLAKHDPDMRAGGTSLAAAACEGVSESYQDAYDATNDIGEGFVDGLDVTISDAGAKANELMQTVIDNMNGGNGYNQAKDAGRNMVGGYGDGIAEAAGEAKTKAKTAMDDAVNALNGGQGYNEAKSAGRNLVGGYGDGVAEAGNEVKSKADSVRQKVIDALGKVDGLASAARTFVSKYGEGLSSSASTVSSHAKSIVNAAVNALQNSATTAANAGKSLGNSYATGISNAASMVKSKAQTLLNSATSALKQTSGATTSGKTVGNAFGTGLSNTSSTVNSKAQSLAKNAVDKMKGQQSAATSAGKTLGTAFANGITNAASTAQSKGSSLGTSAANGMKSSSAQSVAKSAGQTLANSFINGIGSKDPTSAGKTLANKALNGVGKVSAYTTGQNFGQGYADGISSKNSEVYNKAYSMAIKAVQAVKKATNTKSPSRELYELGEYFGEGYGLGISASTRYAVQKASDMATRAIGATNTAMEKGSTALAMSMPGINSSYTYACKLEFDADDMRDAVAAGVLQAMASKDGGSQELVVNIDGAKAGSAILRSLALNGVKVVTA